MCALTREVHKYPGQGRMKKFQTSVVWIRKSITWLKRGWSRRRWKRWCKKISGKLFSGCMRKLERLWLGFVVLRKSIQVKPRGWSCMLSQCTAELLEDIGSGFVTHIKILASSVSWDQENPTSISPAMLWPIIIWARRLVFEKNSAPSFLVQYEGVVQFKHCFSW